MIRLTQLLALSGLFWSAASIASLDDIQLPPGFHIEEYADVPNARSLAQQLWYEPSSSSSPPEEKKKRSHRRASQMMFRARNTRNSGADVSPRPVSTGNAPVPELPPVDGVPLETIDILSSSCMVRV